MKDTITAHIKLDDQDWRALSRSAENLDLTTAQLVRNILRGWVAGQVIVSVINGSPMRAQDAGHRGYDPTPRMTETSNHWQNWYQPGSDSGFLTGGKQVVDGAVDEI